MMMMFGGVCETAEEAYRAMKLALKLMGQYRGIPQELEDEYEEDEDEYYDEEEDECPPCCPNRRRCDYDDMR